MAGVSKTLAAVTAAAPVLAGMGAAPALAATSASGDASTPSVICCEGAGHYVTWQNRADALYLHVKGSSTANSAAVNVYEKTGSCAQHGVTDTTCSEEWSQISTAYANQFAFQNVNSGLCLDDPEDKADVGAVQYSCGTFPIQRRWKYTGYIGTGTTDNDVLYNANGSAGDGLYWLCVSGTNVNIGYNGGTPSITCGWQ